MGPGPGRPGPAGLPGPGGRLPLPPGGGAPPLGGHDTAPPGRHRRRPQGQRPPRPHRQRGRPESAERHRPSPRTGRQAGKTPHCRGPGGRPSHGAQQAPPGKREEAGIVGEGLLGDLGWTWRCSPSSGTACYDDQRPRPSPGATWKSGRTGAP